MDDAVNVLHQSRQGRGVVEVGGNELAPQRLKPSSHAPVAPRRPHVETFRRQGLGHGKPKPARRTGDEDAAQNRITMAPMLTPAEVPRSRA